MIAIDVAKEFKSRNKVEVLNTIVLSDGENTDSFNVVDINVDGNVTFNRFRTTPNKLVLKDGYTSVVVTEPDSSFYRGWGSISRGISLKGVMELFKSVTESRMIHLFLCGKSKREVKNNWHDMTGIRDHWTPNPEFEKTYKEFWNKKDFLPVDSVWGFDAAFLIKGDSLKVEEAELEIKSDKKPMCCVDSASFSLKRLIPATSSTDSLIRLRKLLISKGKKIKLFSPNFP